MLIEKILSGITQEEKSRQRTSPLRMSSSGKCARAIAYQLHGYQASDLSSRAIMVFRLGDTIEAEVKALIEKYCKGMSIHYPKDTISFQVGNKYIPGHPDGLIGDDTVLEVKSINGMRFKNLDREGIPEDYKAQATAYMHALNRKKTLFVFYCKDTSHLREMEFEYNPALFEQIKNNFQLVIDSTKEQLPPRKYEPLKSGQLPWQCSYCSYTQHCWPDYELKFDSKNKPQYVKKGN